MRNVAIIVAYATAEAFPRTPIVIFITEDGGGIGTEIFVGVDRHGAILRSKRTGNDSPARSRQKGFAEPAVAASAVPMTSVLHFAIMHVSSLTNALAPCVNTVIGK